MTRTNLSCKRTCDSTVDRVLVERRLKEGMSARTLHWFRDRVKVSAVWSSVTGA